jgi:hypothetical protein
MSETNAATLRPGVIVTWLRNEADGFGEDGETDFQNMMHKIADDIEQIYDPAIYGEPPADAPAVGRLERIEAAARLYMKDASDDSTDALTMLGSFNALAAALAADERGTG